MTLRDLYLWDLGQLLDATRQKLLEWPVLAARTELPRLREAFDSHYAQSRIHEALIEGLFARLDERPRRGAGPETFLAVARVWRRRHMEAESGLLREVSLVTAGMAMDHHTLPLYAEAISAARAIGDLDGARTLSAAAAEEEERTHRLQPFHEWLVAHFEGPRRAAASPEGSSEWLPIDRDRIHAGTVPAVAVARNGMPGPGVGAHQE